MGAVPLWLARAAAVEGKKRKILVAIFQRGAADGLNIVVPFAEKRYRELRPTLAIAAAHRTDQRRMARSTETRSIWTGVRAEWRDAAAEGAVGQAATGDCRGHRFARSVALAFRRAGLHGIGHARQDQGDGWLNRALPPAGAGDVAVARRRDGQPVPRTLRGEHEAIAVGDPQQFNMGNQDAASILESMYATSADAQWGRTGKDAFEAMKLIQSINRQPSTIRRTDAQYGHRAAIWAAACSSSPA